MTPTIHSPRLNRPPLPEVKRVDPHVLPRSASKVRAVVLAQALHNGGGERWIEDLVSTTDPERVEWLGVGLSAGVSSEIAAARIERHAPVVVGTKECEQLAKSADVVVGWCHTHTFGLPEGKPAIWISHSGPDSNWGTDLARTPRPGYNVDVAVSDDAALTFSPADRSGVIVVENAFNPSRITPSMAPREFRRKHSIPTSVRLIAYVGRLSSEKGWSAFCRSVDHLPDSWHLVAAGAAYTESDRKQTSRIDNPRVHLVGELDRIGDLLQCADALVVPSEYESFGYSIVEGWGAGVPVIATCVGVARKNPDLIRAIPNPATPRAIAMAAIEDLSSPEDTALRCERAKVWVEQNHPIEKFGREWTDLICKVAGK